MKTDTSGSMWKPSTKLGRWSVGLAITFIVLFLINGAFMSFRSNAPWQQVVLPFYGIFMMLCGLAAGLVGLTAILRQHERSLPVWLTILPLLFMLFLLLGEFLGPPH
ncbi:MAG: hypothetical protein HZB50_02740 [Chloroflexi bacterium]|nr:hypothetical protein [Chloroflexota bacterium]